MKAYFLPLGAGAEAALPAVLTAFGCGAARQPASVSLLRVPDAMPDSLTDRLLGDLCACHAFFAGMDAFAFFHTEWKSAFWLPDLPGREALVKDEKSSLLLQALRGDGVPFSFRTDREAAEWSVSALLAELRASPGAAAQPVKSGKAGATIQTVKPGETGAAARTVNPVGSDAAAQAGPIPPDEETAGPSESRDISSGDLKDPHTEEPLLHFLSQIDADLSAGEDVRILLLCDLTEGYGTGLALGLLRFLRARFRERENAPFLGLVGQGRAFGTAGEEGARQIRDTLSALRERNLVRISEDRDTTGADAFWLLGMPASLQTGKDSALLLDWAAARVLGEAWTSPVRPGAGLHTREIPFVLNLQALDQEARPVAAFLRGSCWCLSDLFPALHSYLEHPALLRSLAPASRGGLFRRLFRDAEGGASPAGLALLERTLRALLLQGLRLLQSLPPLMKDAALSTAAWEKAVRACGRTVTVASEYDVRRQEAEESGVDKVQPVHRVSMDDTAEEEALHRLDRLASDLAAAGRQREEVFSLLGGCGARMVLEDCLAKCRVAEVSAREKLIQMSSGSPEERFALGLQQRRTRMLKAAVERCLRDLEEAKKWERISRSGTLRPDAPFAGEVMDPTLAGQAFTMLTGEEPAAGEAAKALRDGLGGLLPGYTLNDAKTLLKNLLSTVRHPEEEAPLRSLLAGVFSVCGVEVSGLRFSSAGQLPSLALLPDLTEEGRFFTLTAAPERILIHAPEDKTAQRRGLLALILLREYRRRGLMEAALELVSLQPEDSPLTEVYLSSRNVESAALCVLSGGSAEAPRKLPLGVLLPGIGLEPARPQPAKRDLIPSFAFWIDRETLLPGDPCAYLSEADRQILTQQLTRLRAGLKDPRSHGLQDFLSDWHRDIQQIPRRTEPAGSLRRRLRVACGLARLPLWQKELLRIPSFYEPALSEDPVCAALLGTAHAEAASCEIREDVIYAFRGTPIAREHPRRLLESTRAPGEEVVLSSLDTECDILRHSSDDYHEALAEGLRELRLRCPGAEAEALDVLEELEKEAGEPIRDAVTELTWPWDTHSTSVMTILTECLGRELAGPALGAFSDRLALFPARGGEILGDLMLSGMCQVSREIPKASPEEDAAPRKAPELVFAESGAGFPEGGPAVGSADPAIPGMPENGPAGGIGVPGYAAASVPGVSSENAAEPVPAEEEKPEAQVRPDAVLPPLSPEFARALCRSPQGQSLLSPRFLACEAAGASLQVTLTLEGAFTLKLKREYGPEEIHSFYAHDLPTLALWPSLPFPPESWHAYFSYAHAQADFRFTALSRTEEKQLQGQAPRFAACQEEYPLGYLVFWQEEPLGAVPNLLPAPEAPVSGPWTACVDFGAAASSVVFTDGQNRWPLQGAVTVRTLLRSPAATENVLWREFLPAVPVSPLLPGALRLFRNEPGEADLPLRDGTILMSSSLRDVLDAPAGALYTDLKWNGEKGRTARLYLHQLMLMAALQARCGGAASLGWRAALPDAMAPEGRERLARIFSELAETVSRESGLPLPEKAPPAAFAAESAALGAYFRFCAPDQARGGFLTLDQGADTADLSLFLRGREEAVRTCQLPLGLHHMLLPSLLRKPGLLREDFGFVEDEGFQKDLLDLQAVLEKARMDPAALRQARYGLDALLADRLPLLLDALFRRRAGGEPGRVGALYLLYESFLMMLSGLLLMQIAGDALRNDELPEAMTLFLAGRGSQLTESLSLQTKTSLWKLLTMFRNPRVQSLQLVFSAEKKLEIPVGLSLLSPGATLPRAAQEPAAAAVRPEELMPEFLLRFRREFPGEAAILFPGVYANDYYAPFTPYGQQLLVQAVQAAFGGQEPGRPFPALAACLNHLLDMIQEGLPL